MYLAKLFALSAIVIISAIPNLAQAKTKWKTSHYLEMAREALSLGMSSKWRSGLQKAQWSYRKEKSSMRQQDQDNYALMLAISWSRYYQFVGKLPKVKRTEEFESVQEVGSYIVRFQRCIRFLKKGLAHLQTYNLLYSQISRRSDIRNQLHLQASVGLERDLRNNIRDARIYREFLKFVVNHWMDKQKLRSRMDRQQQTISSLRSAQSQSEQNRTGIIKLQRKLGVVLAKVETLYRNEEQKLEQRAQSARVLLWSGVGGLVLGAGATAAGLGLYIQSHSTQLGQTEAAAVRTGGLIGLVLGGMVIALGSGLVVTGVVLRPKPTQYDHAIIQAQNKYIDSQRRKPNMSQSIPKVLMNTFPQPNRERAQFKVLGTWQ